jgi:hypothetical protein
MFIFTEQDYLYDWISVLYKDHIYFGPFPNQVMIDRMIQEGFNVIVNLTMPEEEPLYVLPYHTRYYCFPIEDNHYPFSPEAYCRLISRLKMDVCCGKKLYIHCRGGHGRSSMTSVSLVCNLFNYDLRHAIAYVNDSHNQREVLRNKWRKRKSPFNYDQFIFLTKMHKNIYLNVCDYNRYYQWLLPSVCEPVQYITMWSATNRYYQNIYDLCSDDTIFYDDKFCSLFSFLYQRIMTNIGADGETFYNKLQYTYLKRFIVTDSAYPFFNSLFDDVMRMVRDQLMM